MGNNIWEKVPNPCGRPRLYKSPKKLWDKALEYFRWVDNNPWQLKSATNSLTSDSGKKKKSEEADENKKNAVRQDVRVLSRAYTLYGFCAFAGIYKWGDFKRNYTIDKEKNAGFLEVINAIELVITSQQIDGAMLHQFDSNLVARLNNISDTTKTELTGKDGEPIAMTLPKLTNEDIDKIRKLNDRL